MRVLPIGFTRYPGFVDCDRNGCHDLTQCLCGATDEEHTGNAGTDDGRVASDDMILSWPLREDLVVRHDVSPASALAAKIRRASVGIAIDRSVVADAIASPGQTAMIGRARSLGMGVADLRTLWMSPVGTA
jgi:hypothetical protein